MTESAMQKAELASLVYRLQNIAAKVGPCHAWWDFIADMKAHLENRPTVLKKTTSEWIAEANKLLKDDQ